MKRPIVEHHQQKTEKKEENSIWEKKLLLDCQRVFLCFVGISERKMLGIQQKCLLVSIVMEVLG